MKIANNTVVYCKFTDTISVMNMYHTVKGIYFYEISSLTAKYEFLYRKNEFAREFKRRGFIVIGKL